MWLSREQGGKLSGKSTMHELAVEIPGFHSGIERTNTQSDDKENTWPVQMSHHRNSKLHIEAIKSCGQSRAENRMRVRTVYTCKVDCKHVVSI